MSSTLGGWLVFENGMSSCVPLPARFTGVTLNVTLARGMVYLNSVLLIPHCEYRSDEEVKSMTSTQYPVMSGSSDRISSVKGGVQVRMMEQGSVVICTELTADKVPVLQQKISATTCTESSAHA